jgi:hypothetical protein
MRKVVVTTLVLLIFSVVVQAQSRSAHSTSYKTALGIKCGMGQEFPLNISLMTTMLVK